MMKQIAWVVLLTLVEVPPAAAADLPPPLVSGLKNPESIAVGVDGRVYVTVAGDTDKDGEGAIMVIENGKATPFATGLDRPKGLVAWTGNLYAADKQRVWRINRSGRAEVLVKASDFPSPPASLRDICVDERGVIYVTDVGDSNGNGGAIYRIIPPAGRGRGPAQELKVESVADGKRFPTLK